MIRIGIIDSVDTINAVCNIRSDNNEIIERPWLALRAGATQDWNPPTKGEQVVLLCPCGDLAQAIVLPGLYYTGNSAPSESGDETKRRYPDGSTITYNHSEHSFDMVLCEGATININAPSKITIASAATEITTELTVIGNSTLNGTVTVTGATTLQSTLDVAGNTTAADFEANGISLLQHIHQGTHGPTGVAE